MLWLLIPIVVMLIFALLVYFFIARPQRKAEQRQALMVASVKKGSIIYAGGGIRGTVLEVRSNSVVVETAPARTRLEFDSDVIEQVDGFDVRSERAHQKDLREARIARNGSAGRGPQGPHL